jgi:hypothetical protein
MQTHMSLWVYWGGVFHIKSSAVYSIDMWDFANEYHSLELLTADVELRDLYTKPVSYILYIYITNKRGLSLLPLLFI